MLVLSSSLLLGNVSVLLPIKADIGNNRELAMQIFEVASPFLHAFEDKFSLLLLIGGSSVEEGECVISLNISNFAVKIWKNTTKMGVRLSLLLLAD